MIIGDRLRQLREDKKMSQGDVEKRTGLLRCYISRVENGHTVPAIETLEKLARAMEVPMYQLFYEGEEPPAIVAPMPIESSNAMFGRSSKERNYVRSLCRKLKQIGERDRRTLMFLAGKMATGRARATANHARA